MIIKKNFADIHWSINLPITIIIVFLISNLLISYFNISNLFNLVFPQVYFFISIFYIIAFKQIRFKDMGIAKENFKQNLMIGIISICVFALLIIAGEFIIKWFYIAKDVNIYIFHFDFLMFFLMLIAAPICEEIIFRGILFGVLKKEFNLMWAFFLGVSIFAMLHLKFHPGAIVMGVIACFIYHKTNSCIPGIIIHSFGNFLSLTLPYLAPNIYWVLKFFYR